MYAILGDELIYFLCDHEQAQQQLGLLFRGWPKLFNQSPPGEYLVRSKNPLSLVIETHEELKPAPVLLPPIFADPRSRTTVYRGDHFWYVCFGPDAVARIPDEPDAGTEAPIRVQVTRASLSAGRLEDIVFSSLAPALRRRGLFMIHAFAAEKDGSALLLVGESGSGKTTTGLCLISRGWRYLANDVVLLWEKEGTVYALPTPGGIGLDAKTFELLPDFPSPSGHGDTVSKHYYSAAEFIAGWGSGSSVSRILFTDIVAEGETALNPISHSLTLARLMEASVDRWDTASLKDHLHLLEFLGRQAEGFDLTLGRELQRLPALLNQPWEQGND